MKITIKDILRVIEAYAPPAYQESYDNAGLIFGDAGREVTNVLLTLDTTEAVIDEAIANNCNLVIAHHPIVFGGLKKINGKNYVERVAIKAIKHDIAIYAAHTNLDNVHNGVSAMMAERLSLQNSRVLQPKSNYSGNFTLLFLRPMPKPSVTDCLWPAPGISAITVSVVSDRRERARSKGRITPTLMWASPAAGTGAGNQAGSRFSRTYRGKSSRGFVEMSSLRRSSLRHYCAGKLSQPGRFGTGWQPGAADG
ncbi:Nif3-like dinuclear metal center hexameric protein [Chitinophaga sedimenti]|uniref:Nif3-like dinuclear metal center hexameric protein n=1 Tax=Chitinophaga sedimenti TaxID=2033606 RepID=UPI002003BC8F|nr:Nif3-like dinuclear metal center hexameric protein [Chitinophaga sedimenti]MCK7559737.1 Nif3-like dinuclear metal center hexameric protein [Chitinophaga sedimenti]